MTLNRHFALNSVLCRYVWSSEAWLSKLGYSTCNECRRRTLNRKEQLRHRAVSLRQHGFVVQTNCNNCLLSTNFHSFRQTYYKTYAVKAGIVNSPNTVYVTTLPCKILYHKFFTFTAIQLHCLKSRLLVLVLVFHRNIIIFERNVPNNYYLFTTNA